MITFCLRTLLFIFIAFSYCTAKSQDSTVIFYDVIKDDSIVMYFNNSYNFSEKSCSQNKRYTRIDSNGNFYGSFTDINLNDVIIGKGNYENGIKNGYLETFYPNGQLKSKGVFKNNIPSGTWEYFYPNGSPERVVMVNLADTFLIQFYDSSGLQTVKDGNGYFNGEVASDDASPRNAIIASGKIVNGKPDGEWTSSFGKYPYCTERFKDGTFVSGMHKSMLKGAVQYKDRSLLRNLFLPSYIQTLELFHVVKCWNFKQDIAVQKNSPRNTEIDIESFKSYVNDAIGRVLETDMRNENYRDYADGDNLFKVSFKVNEKGVPVDFKQITSWGNQYFYPVTSTLTRFAKLPTSTKAIYFELTMIKREGNTILYRYNFSYN